MKKNKVRIKREEVKITQILVVFFEAFFVDLKDL